MNNKGKDISKIKSKIRYLMTEIGSYERYLMARHRMIDASLVEMKTLAKKRQRKTSAYYLSRKVDGKTKLKYVKKDDMDIVTRRATAWKYYSHNLSEYVKKSKEIESLFRKLGYLSIEIPEGYE